MLEINLHISLGEWLAYIRNLTDSSEVLLEQWQWHTILYRHWAGIDRYDQIHLITCCIMCSLTSCYCQMQVETLLNNVYLSDIYPRSQLRIYWCYFSLSSQHVSAPSDHLQVKHTYITYISWESYLYYNGSVVSQFVSYYLFIQGKCAILNWIDYNFLSR
jgi:hypothetical protein